LEALIILKLRKVKSFMNMNFIHAMAALDRIYEGKESYLDEYRKYVIEHKQRVKKFADWLKENLPELFNEVDEGHFDVYIEEHDASKFSEEEFEPYAQKWFNDGEKTPEYEAAWEHHYKNNEHHPEFWDGQDIPEIFILEMLCDWGSFSIDKGNLNELISFYYDKARDDEEKNLSENTKAYIEEVLSKIDSVINKEDD
jgi:hypothetical protein